MFGEPPLIYLGFVAKCYAVIFSPRALSFARSEVFLFPISFHAEPIAVHISGMDSILLGDCWFSAYSPTLLRLAFPLLFHAVSSVLVWATSKIIAGLHPTSMLTFFFPDPLLVLRDPVLFFSSFTSSWFVPLLRASYWWCFADPPSQERKLLFEPSSDFLFGWIYPSSRSPKNCSPAQECFPCAWFWSGRRIRSLPVSGRTLDSMRAWTSFLVAHSLFFLSFSSFFVRDSFFLSFFLPKVSPPPWIGTVFKSWRVFFFPYLPTSHSKEHSFAFFIVEWVMTFQPLALFS